MKRFLILLSLLPSLAMAQETVTIPLQLLTTTQGLRLGMELSVGGGPTNLYLFDTGSSGLYAAANQVGSGATNTGVAYTQHYDSNIQYVGTVYQGTVTLGSGSTTVSTSNAQFGSITTATGPTTSGFPPTTEGFYGTFGASTKMGSSTAGSLYTIVAQLPGNYSNGFIVHTGGTSGEGISGPPSVTIGLTPENTQGFISAQMLQQSIGTYPNGNTAWDDRSLKAILNLSYEGQEQSFDGSVIFDTGTENTYFRPTQTGGSLNSAFNSTTPTQLNDEVLVNTVVDDGCNWSFSADNTTGQNIVNIKSADPTETFMNTGIDIFLTYDIMYDMVNGLIGYKPFSQMAVGTTPGDTVISGTITDSGSTQSIPLTLIQNGTGTTTLTADNTYSGGTILNAGQLTVSSDSNLGNAIGGVTFNGGELNTTQDFSSGRSYAVFSNGGIFNTNNFTATISGPLSGSGTLQKNGTGLLIYNAVVNSDTTVNVNKIFTGQIQINAGTVQVDTNLQSGSIQVGPDGTLKGIGTVGSVVSNGFVHPGDSPGILNIMGNYTQGPTAALIIELGSLTNFGQLNVSQTAQLGGFLDPINYQGYVPNAGDTFTIINAGSVVGQFAGVGYFLPTLLGVPVYSPTQVNLTFARTYTNPFIHFNRNQLAFGQMLNTLSLDPGGEAALLSLINGISSANVLLETYDSLIPSQYLAQISTAFDRTTITLDTIQRRLRDVPKCDCGCINTSFDIEVKGLYQGHQRTELEYGYLLRGEQINAEIDYAVNSDLLIGIYGDYTHSYNTFHNHKGSFSNNSGALLGYAYYQDCNWYTDLILGGLFHSYSTKRNINVADTKYHVRSDNNAGEVAALLTLGYDYCRGTSWSIDPYILVQAAHIYGSSFREKEAFLVEMQGKIHGANSLQTGLGLNFRDDFCILDKYSFIEIYGEWRHECFQKRYSLNSSLVGSSISFDVVSSIPESDWGFIGVDYNIEVADCFDCYLSYQTLFNLKTCLQCISAGISYLF